MSKVLIAVHFIWKLFKIINIELLYICNFTSLQLYIIRVLNSNYKHDIVILFIKTLIERIVILKNLRCLKRFTRLN